MLKEGKGTSCLPNKSTTTQMDSTVDMSEGTSSISTGNKSHNERQETDSTMNTAKSTGMTKPTATTASSDYAPNKKFGVIFDSVEGLAIEIYLRNIAEKAGGSNIKYASRLSGERVCVYLAAESFVKELSDQRGITIDTTFVQCRPYVMISFRVVLSNVCLKFPMRNFTTLHLVSYWPDLQSPTRAYLSLLSFGRITSNITQLPISTQYILI
jgi:hypothetical protein